MSCRVLVLGANGYVGRRLLTRLENTVGMQAVGAGRRPPTAASSEFRVFDATDTDALGRALQGIDAIVNCVSGSPAVIANSAKALRDAVRATSGRAPQIVHMSSMAAYGNVQGDISEDHPLVDGSTQNYGCAKALAEQLLEELERVVMLRPGCIYGPGSPQWSVRMLQLLRTGRIGDLGENGDSCSNLVFIDNVLDAILAALQNTTPHCRAYNLAMPDAPSWNDYFTHMAYAAGAVPLRRISARQLKLETRILAPCLHVAGVLGRRVGIHTLPPAIPPSLLRLWQQDIRLDSQRASQTWQLAWLPLDTGLQLSLSH